MLRVLAEAKKEERGETPKDLFEANLLDGLRKGAYDNFVIEMDVVDVPQAMELVPGGASISIGNIFGDIFKEKKKKRRLTVREAMEIALEEEASKLVDEDAVKAEALYRAENDGIVFIDEIDKIAGKGERNGADVSREGVQRDILPIVRRLDGRHQIRAGQDGFHPVYCRGRLPRLLHRGPHPRIAGALPRVRRTAQPQKRGFPCAS